MSGKPYPEGVQKLSEQFRLLEAARQDIARADGDLKSAQQELEVANKRHRAANEEIKRLMSEMDVESPGNFGYEDRLMWLLRELNTQAERYGRRGNPNQ